MTTTASAATPASRPPRRRRWLRWVGLAVLVLVLLVALAAGWLLGTGAGLRFALARASAATDGALSVQHAQGRLAGPLDLGGVRYADGKGTDIRLASAHLDLEWWPLLHKRLHIRDLQAEGIAVDLPTATEDDESSGPIELQPPLDIVLDRVHVGSVAIRQGGAPVFASNRLDLVGAWTDDGLDLRQLQLDAPDGHAKLSGKIAIGGDYRGNGTAAFGWTVADTLYAGTLTAHSDGRQAHLELKLTAPTPVDFQLALTQRDDYPWTATLDAPRFDPKPILGDSALSSLALSLRASGDHRGGAVTGDIGVNDYQLQLQPMRAHLSDDLRILQLEQLRLGSPQVKGSVEANGIVQLGADPVSARLDVSWKDLELPADLAGQVLDSHGSLKASGSAAQFHADGAVAIGPPGNLADLQLDLDGTPERITLHSLALKQPTGGMQANGTLALQPVLGWKLEATADNLDPGQLFADWKGAIDFDLASEGQLPDQGPEATLDLRKLAGRLRQRAIRGNGKLHLASDKVLDGRLDLASGNSTIRLDARPGATNDIDLTLAIQSLADWLPDAGGRVDSHLTIRGPADALAVNGTADGRTLSYGAQKIDQLKLVVGVPDIGKPSGKLALTTRGVIAGGMTFQSIDVNAEGSQADHHLTLDARGTELSARLALSGAMKNERWNGTLGTLDLEPQHMPGWRLQSPSQLSYADGAMRMTDLCLTAGDPQLCVAASQDKRGNLDANYRLRALPIALILAATGSAELPIRADGTLEGDGRIHRNAAGALSGNASLRSARGTVTYTDNPGNPLADYRNLTLDAQLAPAGQHVNLHVDLAEGGRIDGQVTLSGAQQTLGGQLELHVADLGFVELFTSELAAVKGRLDGDFRFAGNLAKPVVTGQADINDFAGEVPSAGLKLKQGKLTLATTDAQVFRVNGQLSSGEGSMTIDGALNLASTAPTTLTLKGSRFTAADIPSAKVVISPDLVLRQSKDGINLSGSLSMDSANVNLEQLPGAGATKASPDVVVVDEKKQEAEREAMPLTASITVNLGRKTHVAGMGLDGNVMGQLVVDERPGRATIGRGQLAVDGTYKAYGQNLHIEHGQLLFASTPIDNPGLNIRAVRKLNPNATIDEGQEVGLLVSGKAKRPILTVFSNPVMEQSDALSYLITGKPLSEVKGGEGNMVSAAAQALGSAGGDLLAKRIGSHLGVDDIGVSSSDALGGSSAFTVGKYLSPRLYLSYGVGLFDPGQVISLRYLLSHRWNFEAQNATDFNRASFNYRLEK